MIAMVRKETSLAAREAVEAGVNNGTEVLVPATYVQVNKPKKVLLSNSKVLGCSQQKSLSIISHYFP